MILYAFFFVLFLQLLTGFVGATYALGLLNTKVPLETAGVAFLAAPLLLIALGRKHWNSLFPILFSLVFVARVLVPVLDTRGQALAAGIGVGAAAVLLPLMLSRGDKGSSRDQLAGLTGGLTLAVVTMVLLRALGHGLDISTRGWTQVLVWIPLPIAILESLPGSHGDHVTPANGSQASLFRGALAAVGISSVLTLLYMAFTAPNVISRWTEQGYLPILALLVLAFVGFGLAARMICAAASGWTLVVLNAIFVAALVSTLLLERVDFPADSASYPVWQGDPGPIIWLTLAPALLLSPVLVLDFGLCASHLLEARLPPARLGLSFALGSAVIAIGIFSQVLTSTYDYVPLVGPFFRDRFWVVFFGLALGAALPTLAIAHQSPRLTLARLKPIPAWVAGVVSVAFVILSSSSPATAPTEGPLNVITYNIQQGYDREGQWGLGRQIELLRTLDADIIGLQETDTNRATGGNVDAVRVIAHALRMHSYYGPRTPSGTFGIALLSRYPIEDAETFFMYSAGEQTAAIHGRIVIGQRRLNVVVTHLGNNGPLVQQAQVLNFIAGRPNTVLLGDFNFHRGDAQYVLTLKALDDAWILRWPSGVTDAGEDNRGRVDHVFVSSGTTILNARHVESGASDHDPLLVQIGR